MQLARSLTWASLTERAENLPGADVANGGPLSDRSVRGSPYLKGYVKKRPYMFIRIHLKLMGAE